MNTAVLATAVTIGLAWPAWAGSPPAKLCGERSGTYLLRPELKTVTCKGGSAADCETMKQELVTTEVVARGSGAANEFNLQGKWEKDKGQVIRMLFNGWCTWAMDAESPLINMQMRLDFTEDGRGATGWKRWTAPRGVSATGKKVVMEVQIVVIRIEDADEEPAGRPGPAPKGM